MSRTLEYERAGMPETVERPAPASLAERQARLQSRLALERGRARLIAYGIADCLDLWEYRLAGSAEEAWWLGHPGDPHIEALAGTGPLERRSPDFLTDPHAWSLLVNELLDRRVRIGMRPELQAGMTVWRCELGVPGTARRALAEAETVEAALVAAVDDMLLAGTAVPKRG
jgi:hypothetical protein